MKVGELREELKTRGLDTAGTCTRAQRRTPPSTQGGHPSRQVCGTPRVLTRGALPPSPLAGLKAVLVARLKEALTATEAAPPAEEEAPEQAKPEEPAAVEAPVKEAAAPVEEAPAATETPADAPAAAGDAPAAAPLSDMEVKKKSRAERFGVEYKPPVATIKVRTGCRSAASDTARPVTAPPSFKIYIQHSATRRPADTRTLHCPPQEKKNARAERFGISAP